MLEKKPLCLNRVLSLQHKNVKRFTLALTTRKAISVSSGLTDLLRKESHYQIYSMFILNHRPNPRSLTELKYYLSKINFDQVRKSMLKIFHNLCLGKKKNLCSIKPLFSMAIFPHF